MIAIHQRAYGEPADVLSVMQLERPTPEPGEALVRVAAAGVSIGISHLTVGVPYLVRLVAGLRRPRNPLPGLDVAGTVEAVGSPSSDLEIGAEVVGWANGTWAEYVCVPLDQLHAKPDNLGFDQAAALGDSAITALKAVRDQGEVGPGQSVLINGASGGVGTYAVQIAKQLGAEVTGVCSAASGDMVRGLGADEIIDYKTQDFLASTRKYDVLVDMIGNRPLRDCLRVLTSGGIYVLVGVADMGRILGLSRQARAFALAPFVKQKLRVFVAMHSREDLGTVLDLAAAGQLTPRIQERFPLDRAPEALTRQREGRVKGKLVLTV